MIKYLTPMCYVFQKEMCAGCIPCAPPHNGPAVVALWLIFEEVSDLRLFTDNTSSASVDDWWSKLLPRAHALPTLEVRVSQPCSWTHESHQGSLPHVCQVMNCILADEAMGQYRFADAGQSALPVHV